MLVPGKVKLCISKYLVLVLEAIAVEKRDHLGYEAYVHNPS